MQNLSTCYSYTPLSGVSIENLLSAETAKSTREATFFVKQYSQSSTEKLKLIEKKMKIMS